MSFAPSDSALDSGEPGYIGAWWLGFLIIAILVLLSAMPMYYFPKHFAEYYTQKLNCAVTVEREQRPVGRRQLVVREINGGCDRMIGCGSREWIISKVYIAKGGLVYKVMALMK